MTTPRAILLAATLVLFAQNALAQLVTSTVPRSRTVPVKDAVEESMSIAPWQLGPVRLQPKFGVRNFGYIDNVLGVDEDEEEPVDDWTATVAAGLEAYLPVGAKGVLRARALPEYTWYKDLADRRQFGGFYDVSAFGFFNRLTVDLNAFTSETVRNVTSESEVQADVETTGLSAKAEVEIFRRLSIFAGADQRDLGHDTFETDGDPELAFDRLDRSESAARAGVRYAWRSYFDVSVLAETTETEFDAGAISGDNESEAILLGVHYDRPKFYVNLTGGQREGSAINGSLFPDYSETTGSWFAEYRLTAPIDVQAFGSRDIGYSLTDESPYFLEDRTGAAIRFQLGSRIAVRILGETGENDYPVQVLRDGVLRDRVDDTQTFGATISIPLWRRFALTVGATQTDFDSNLSGFDRSVFRIVSVIGLRSEVFR